jgi:hypothetical protein
MRFHFSYIENRRIRNEVILIFLSSNFVSKLLQCFDENCQCFESIIVCSAIHNMNLLGVGAGACDCLTEWKKEMEREGERERDR